MFAQLLITNPKLHMNILFIGDIVGKIGRKAIAKILPKLKKELKTDLVVANAENSAHGAGVTESIIKELQKCGVDYFTTGDHAFRNKKDLDIFNKLPVLRPANFSPHAPGQGHAIIEVKGRLVLLINLVGRIFMSGDHECPFHKLNEILANPDLPIKKVSAIIIDVHAETTSEKVNIGHFADGRASAVLGTHTHIMTADHKVTDKGTAYITDVGMAGVADESIGIAKEGTLKTFLTQIKEPHVIPEKGRAIFNSVLVQISTKTKKATSIKPITQFVNIK